MLKFTPMAIIIYIIFFILSVIYMVKHKKTFLELFCTNLFVIFILFVISITLFPMPVQPKLLDMLRNHGYDTANNFIPFASIYHMISTSIPYTSIRQIGGNLCILIPLGIYAPLYFKGMNKFKNFVLLAFLFSAGIEFLQFLIGFILQFNYRSVDVDDIILNVLGAMIGYIIYLIIIPVYYKILTKMKINKKTR